MPVCHNKKLVFIHIPRTGGTSIAEALHLTEYTNPFETPSPQHLTLQQLQVYAKQDFADYFKFTVVRDEVARMYSEFKWRISKKDISHVFNDEFDVESATFQEFQDFVNAQKDYTKHTYDHFRPQSDYLHGLDKIFFSLKEVEKHFDITLPKRNTS